MIALIAKRLGAAAIIVLALTAVMFILQKVSPVDPVHAMLGPSASPASVLHEEHVLGLDRPVPAQFLSYLNGLLHGEPAVTLDALRHLVMPALAIAVVPAVSIGRVLRSSLLTGMQSDYVRTARAKGLSERAVVFRHVLRNCLSAALSMTGLQVGLMFSGVLVIEEIFAWPGVGEYMAQSIPAADFPAISGVTLLLGIGYVAVNTLVDILQAVADPRINTQ